jgi:hypothetical protein
VVFYFLLLLLSNDGTRRKMLGLGEAIMRYKNFAEYNLNGLLTSRAKKS